MPTNPYSEDFAKVRERIGDPTKCGQCKGTGFVYEEDWGDPADSGFGYRVAGARSIQHRVECRACKGQREALAALDRIEAQATREAAALEAADVLADEFVELADAECCACCPYDYPTCGKKLCIAFRGKDAAAAYRAARTSTEHPATTSERCGHPTGDCDDCTLRRDCPTRHTSEERSGA